MNATLHSFHNTNGESQAEAQVSEIHCQIQEALIKTFFANNPGQFYTPFEVAKETGINAPITSIRRAMTNLTKKGVIEKTDLKKRGVYGKLNFTWRAK